MRAAVLEDKLAMLLALVSAAPSTALAAEHADVLSHPSYADDVVKEIMAKRVWDPLTHPEWLAFEVDSDLRIRPQQYAIACEMLDNPGAVVQLNMGEGKTRVILPMLILEKGKHKGMPGNPRRPIVRLIMLSQLLHEGFDYLHALMSGGVLGRKLMRMPFHRDIQLSAANVEVMCAHAEYCQREGGVIVVNPESRCSLHL
jgi:hypothetical protein